MRTRPYGYHPWIWYQKGMGVMPGRYGSCAWGHSKMKTRNNWVSSRWVHGGTRYHYSPPRPGHNRFTVWVE